MCDSDNGQSLHRRRVVHAAIGRADLVVGRRRRRACRPRHCAANVTETDVMVPTPDGKADAALFHPAGTGSWPAVLMWPDILGLRPVFREMGRRLAAARLYGARPQPLLQDQARADRHRSVRFQRSQAGRASDEPQGDPDRCRDRHGRGGVHHLPRPAEADRRRKRAGVQGYCFSGPFAFHTGGGPVRPDSRGRQLPWRQARHQGREQPAPADPEDEGQLRCRDRAATTIRSSPRPRMC